MTQPETEAQGLIGGLGKYPSTASHGPFVHVTFGAARRGGEGFPVHFHNDSILIALTPITPGDRGVSPLNNEMHMKVKAAIEAVIVFSLTLLLIALVSFSPIGNWRWQDVPFYLRTGKRLTRQASEIAIQFRGVPHQSFPPKATLDWQPSCLVISIQPDEGIVLRFQAKHPGPKMHLRSVEMQFNYQDAFSARSPDPYETLLWDVMKDDATLLMRADQVEAAWRVLIPVLDGCAVAPPSDFPNYAAGTWGPEDTQGLLAQKHHWPLPTELIGHHNTKGER
jgi:hypothetical protein